MKIAFSVVVIAVLLLGLLKIIPGKTDLVRARLASGKELTITNEMSEDTRQLLRLAQAVTIASRQKQYLEKLHRETGTWVDATDETEPLWKTTYPGAVNRLKVHEDGSFTLFPGAESGVANGAITLTLIEAKAYRWECSTGDYELLPELVRSCRYTGE